MDMESEREDVVIRFTLGNLKLLEKQSMIESPVFVCNECAWLVEVHPKGNYLVEDHLSVYLRIVNPESLRPGWRSNVTWRVIMLDESGKVLRKKTAKACDYFCAEAPVWGHSKLFPLSKLEEEGFLKNNKLIIKVQVIDHHQGDKEMFDINGFQILYSQISSVSWIFNKHPDIAVNFRPKNQSLKTTYMNVLLRLIRTLDKPPQSLSETQLTEAHSDWRELTEAGFKLDWLKEKLDERRNKAPANENKAKSFLEQMASDLNKERSAKFATSIVASFKYAFCCWNASSRAGYDLLPPS